MTDRDPARQLAIVQKCEDMIAYGHQALVHFPKHERHVMSQEIRIAMWDVHRLIITAHKRYGALSALRELDVALAVLRGRLRVATAAGHLPPRKLAQWSEHTSELGRMVGGWLKTERATDQTDR